MPKLPRNIKQTQGLLTRWKAERTDGSSGPGGRHDGCRVFVLDPKHDKFARTALQLYAAECAEEYPHLAEDLREWMRDVYLDSAQLPKSRVRRT